MSFVKSSLSVVGKLGALLVLIVVFFAGLTTVVYMSLQGTEITVPEITGKNFNDSEHELEALGLKIKKRADRVSQDPPNTVIEQLPHAGETVKTGQMILVVTSRAPTAGETAPVVAKPTEEDDTEKIEEMISDKPKKPKTNTNSNRKKNDANRDANADNANSDSNSGSNSNSSNSNSNRKEHEGNNNSTSNPKNTQTPPRPKETPKPTDGRPKLANRP